MAKSLRDIIGPRAGRKVPKGEADFLDQHKVAEKDYPVKQKTPGVPHTSNLSQSSGDRHGHTTQASSEAAYGQNEETESDPVIDEDYKKPIGPKEPKEVVHKKLSNFAQHHYQGIAPDLPKHGHGHNDAAIDHTGDSMYDKYGSSYPKMSGKFTGVAKKALKGYLDKDEPKETRANEKKQERAWAKKNAPAKTRATKPKDPRHPYNQKAGYTFTQKPRRSKMSEEQTITELSGEKNPDIGDPKQMRNFHLKASRTSDNKIAKWFHKDRAKGYQRHVTDRKKQGLGEEETITELSRQTLGSYIKKASDSRADGQFDAQNAQNKAGAGGIGNLSKKAQNKYGKDIRKVQKRRSGIRLATDKLTKEETQIDELRGKGELPDILKGHADVAWKSPDSATRRYHNVSIDRTRMLKDKAKGRVIPPGVEKAYRDGAKSLRNKIKEETMDEVKTYGRPSHPGGSWKFKGPNTPSENPNPQKHSPAMQAAIDRINAAFKPGSIKVGGNNNMAKMKKEMGMKEDTLNEISKGLTNRYLSKADGSHKQLNAKKAFGVKGLDKKIKNRVSGSALAVRKNVGSANVPATPEKYDVNRGVAKIKSNLKRDIDEDQINEISRKLAGEYLKKSAHNQYDLAVKHKKATGKERLDLHDKIERRREGQKLAILKRGARVQATEETLDEVSKDKLGNYIKQASHKNMYKSIAGVSSDTYDGDSRAIKTYNKRSKGIERAADKLSGKARIQATEETLSEVSRKKAFAAYAGTQDPDRDDDDGLYKTGERLKGHIKKKWGKDGVNNAERHAFATHFGRGKKNVKEEKKCNSSKEGVHCHVHGKKACPTKIEEGTRGMDVSSRTRVVDKQKKTWGANWNTQKRTFRQPGVASKESLRSIISKGYEDFKAKGGKIKRG